MVNTALSVARTLGRSVTAVTAYEDIDTRLIRKDLALGPRSAALIGELGSALAVPGAPTAPAATVVNTTHVSVAFTAPASDGGDAITGYEVTSSAGGFVGTANTSPVVVTGAFAAATSYTFTVKAINTKGKSVASSASSAVYPNPTVPGVPTSPVGTVTNATTVSVAFSAPGATGGSAITGYEATSSPGGFVATNATSPVIVVGAYVTATPYTWTVKAINAVGKSAASAASAAKTPNP